VAIHPPSPASLFVFVYSSCGKCPFPTFQWSFPHIATVTSFPTPRLLGGCCHSCFLRPACLSTVPWGIAPPPPLWRSGHPTLFAMCLFCCCLFSLGFFSLFFPGWGSVCPGGYSDLSQGCLWEYHVLLISPGGLLLSSW
jgi:hypothetical protein